MNLPETFAARGPRVCFSPLLIACPCCGVFAPPVVADSPRPAGLPITCRRCRTTSRLWQWQSAAHRAYARLAAVIATLVQIHTRG